MTKKRIKNDNKHKFTKDVAGRGVSIWCFLQGGARIWSYAAGHRPQLYQFVLLQLFVSEMGSSGTDRQTDIQGAVRKCGLLQVRSRNKQV